MAPVVKSLLLGLGALSAVAANHDADALIKRALRSSSALPRDVEKSAAEPAGPKTQPTVADEAKATAPQIVKPAQTAQAAPMGKPAQPAQPAPEVAKVQPPPAQLPPLYHTEVLGTLETELMEARASRENVMQLQQALTANVALLRESSSLARVSTSPRKRAAAQLQVREAEKVVRELSAMLKGSRAAAYDDARHLLREAHSVRVEADEVATEAEAQVRLLASTAPRKARAPAPEASAPGAPASAAAKPPATAAKAKAAAKPHAESDDDDDSDF